MIAFRGGGNVRAALKDVRSKLIDRLLDNMQQRFPQVNLIEAMQVST